MELLTSPKSMYLLEAGLEVLHQETNEWRSDLQFWTEEIPFFLNLIRRDKNQSIPKSAKASLERIEGELLQIITEEIDKLNVEVELHEYFLCKMMETPEKDQQDYREKHKQLSIRVGEFEKRFKLLKMEIFKLSISQLKKDEQTTSK
jgi:hypothetical protein